ncbi:MAG: lipase family protein [Actinomycetota bacterium]|nr:lipase family protein [Actinomycetota bacterium]
MLLHTTAVQPARALQYGCFVKAAYDVYAAHPNDLNPSRSQYPEFPEGFELHLNIQMSDFFGDSTTPKYYGFVARNQADRGEFVVAIRGTQTWQEWWDDFHWELVPFRSLANGGNVAEGFMALFETLAFTAPDPSTAPTPVRDEALDGATSLVLVGHSLGSALVTLYAADIASAGKVQPKVYTLASPRVGDAAFAAAYNTAVAANYRIYNWPDLVPAFPKDPFDNYQHVKGGYEVDSLCYPETVQISLVCFHSLLTYLFLLGAPASILGGWDGCGY